VQDDIRRGDNREMRGVTDMTQDPVHGNRPEEERRVLNVFFEGARLKAFPAQEKKRQIVYREVLRRIPRRESYQERDLNEMLAAIHPDYCRLRRAFVDSGYMQRAHGVYHWTEAGSALLTGPSPV
jgi:hypothetical protein